MNIPELIFENLELVFWAKITKLFDADADQDLVNPESGMAKVGSGILDKYPGSATLVILKSFLSYPYTPARPVLCLFDILSFFIFRPCPGYGRPCQASPSSRWEWAPSSSPAASTPPSFTVWLFCFFAFLLFCFVAFFLRFCFFGFLHFCFFAFLLCFLRFTFLLFCFDSCFVDVGENKIEIRTEENENRSILLQKL
jgi:hypothetical protein